MPTGIIIDDVGEKVEEGGMLRESVGKVGMGKVACAHGRTIFKFRQFFFYSSVFIAFKFTTCE